MRAAFLLAFAFSAACSRGDSSASAANTCCTVTIRVRVPAGSDTVFVAGSLQQLGPWQARGLAMTGTGPERSVQLTVPPGTAFEYKFTLGSWDREALTFAGAVPPNHRLAVTHDTTVENEVWDWKKDISTYVTDWRGSGVIGRLVYWTDVPSQFLDSARNVEIWLPPEYDSNTTTRFPVLYMSDGQNLFDPRIAATGTDWGVDEAVMRLVGRGVMPPVIVVGVWNTRDRSAEYSPWHRAPQYARFLIEELMPRVNRDFRTLTGPQNTAHMGSSMGGLVSWYLVSHDPQVFGACGCLSTAFVLSEAWAARVGLPAANPPDTALYIVRDIERGFRIPPRTRYWFSYGGLGIDSAFGPSHELVRTWLRRQGKVEGRDFVIRRYPELTHNEASWRAELDDALTFLYGRRSR